MKYLVLRSSTLHLVAQMQTSFYGIFQNKRNWKIVSNNFIIFFWILYSKWKLVYTEYYLPMKLVLRVFFVKDRADFARRQSLTRQFVRSLQPGKKTRYPFPKSPTPPSSPPWRLSPSSSPSSPSVPRVILDGRGQSWIWFQSWVFFWPTPSISFSVEMSYFKRFYYNEVTVPDHFQGPTA